MLGAIKGIGSRLAQHGIKKNMTRGGFWGAAGGAALGAFSDEDNSILRGALRGAAIGGMAGAGWTLGSPGLFKGLMGNKKTVAAAASAARPLSAPGSMLMMPKSLNRIRRPIDPSQWNSGAFRDYNVLKSNTPSVFSKFTAPQTINNIRSNNPYRNIPFAKQYIGKTQLASNRGGGRVYKGLHI